MIVKSNRTTLKLLRLNERAREVPKVFKGGVEKGHVCDQGSKINVSKSADSDHVWRLKHLSGFADALLLFCSTALLVTIQLLQRPFVNIYTYISEAFSSAPNLVRPGYRICLHGTHPCTDC